jgi:hypothetical protein
LLRAIPHPAKSAWAGEFSSENPERKKLAARPLLLKVNGPLFFAE